MIIQLYKPSVAFKGMWSWYAPSDPRNNHLPLTYTLQECEDHICDALGVTIYDRSHYPSWVILYTEE